MPLDVFTNTDAVTILGPVTISKDPVTATDGNLTVNGTTGITVASGGVSAKAMSGGQSTLATVSTSGTITTSGVRTALCTVADAVTAVILQTGTLAAQELTVINENATASKTITMAASGTSNVAGGTGCVISALRAVKFAWDSTTSLWYQA